jgi:hypothetical protein
MEDSEDLISFCFAISGVSRNSRMPPMNSTNGEVPFRNQPNVNATDQSGIPSKTASAHFCEKRITLSNVRLNVHRTFLSIEMALLRCDSVFLNRYVTKYIWYSWKLGGNFVLKSKLVNSRFPRTVSTEIAVTNSSRLPTVELLTFSEGGCRRMILVPTAGLIVAEEPLELPVSEATRTYELARLKELARGLAGRSGGPRLSSSSIDRIDNDDAGRRTGVFA